MKTPLIAHISEFDVDNSFELKPMSDLMESNWNLYTYVESLYEFFFISRLNEFGANLLILLNDKEIDNSVDVIELVDLLSLCTFQEVASLEFFCMDTLFTVYFLQVHSDYKEIHSLLRDSYYWNKDTYLDS